MPAAGIAAEDASTRRRADRSSTQCVNGGYALADGLDDELRSAARFPT